MTASKVPMLMFHAQITQGIQTLHTVLLFAYVEYNLIRFFVLWSPNEDLSIDARASDY